MAKTKHTHVPRKQKTKKFDLRPFAIGTIAVGLILVTFSLHAAPTGQLQQTPKVVTASAPAPRQQASPAKPTPAPQPTPAPTPSPKPAVAAVIPQGTKPEPVVTPSPSSSVSSLAPVTTSGSSTSSPASGSATAASPPATTTGYTSANWSGYLAANGSFSAITGSWVVPSVTGVSGVTTADSAWIGIGGVTSGDLIQVGTEDQVSPTGQVFNAAFYELLPDSAITIPSISVSAGDTMIASLKQTSLNQWTITITDQTNGQSFTLNTTYASSDSSAEWIEEDPSYSFRRQVPFDNFHSISFSSGTTTLNENTITIPNSNAEPVTMLDRFGNPIATPSALTGSGFSVTRN